MIKYKCPKCGYTMAAGMVIGKPQCPKCKIPLVQTE